MSIGVGACCVGCQTYLMPKKNGVYVLETFEDGIRPYKIWMSDLLQCPDCGFQLLKGFGFNPVSEHFQSDFDGWLEQVKFTIKGCPRNLSKVA